MSDSAPAPINVAEPLLAPVVPGVQIDNAQPGLPPLAANAPVRHFLFVTAPFGPFSRRLARRLRAEGAVCNRILINGGDLVDWGRDHTTAYRNGHDAWPWWIERHLAAAGVTDLITHGDSHPYAIAAIRAARDLGLNVHVLEQGYLRPHWITLERNGVNAHSSLPRLAEYYAQLVRAPEPDEPVAMGRTTPEAVLNVSRYHATAVLLSPLFGRYRSPYVYSPAHQSLGHIRRYLGQRLARPRSAADLARLVETPGPIFLALLQRPGDSQLVRHSALGTCAGFIERVIDSFAAHAPPDARLLFKAHPLDHGLEPHRRAIKAAAPSAGVGSRVFFTDDGHFPSLVRRSCGVVSVNSTGGLAALEAGKPTIVLGQAIYDLTGLTHQTGLDNFWTAAEQPDTALFEAYRAVLIERTQVNGAFSTRHGVALAVAGVARRLLAE